MTTIIKKEGSRIEAVYEELKRVNKPVSLAEIAEAMGVTVPQILSHATQLEKAGALIKTEVEKKKFYAYNVEATIVFEDAPKKGKISDKGKLVMGILRDQTISTPADEGMSAKEIAEELSEITGEVVLPISINGVVNGLVKKGFAVREPIEVQAGEVVKLLKIVKLTELGKTVSLD